MINNIPKTVRVTVKMSEKLKDKLQARCERMGVDMSSYIRSLIEKRLSPAAGQCYECLGRLEEALNEEEYTRLYLNNFLREKYAEGSDD